MFKLVLSSATAFAAVSAFACPDLQGSYVCTYEDGTAMESDIGQSVKNGVTTYELDDMTVVADGKERPVSQEGLVGTVSAVCKGNSVVANLKGTIADLDNAKVSVELIIAKTANGASLSQKGTLVAEGQTYPVNDNATCEKK